MNALTTPETESIITLCLMASFADGDKHEREREQIKKITGSLAGDEIDLTRLYQDVLLKKPEISAVASSLASPELRQLAYEMAVCVCDADDVRNEPEQQFLYRLRSALSLSVNVAQAADAEAAALTTIPVSTTVSAQSEETDAMILRYAIVGGALELLPQTMATLAILPLQSKMVYRIGKERGFELDRKSIGEFIATVGLGLASQVFEGFARRLTKGLGKSIGGKIGGKVGGAVTGIAMSFGSTYALGQLAKLYYDSGRSLSIEALKSKFTPLLAEGKSLAEKYTSQITAQSQQLQGANLTTLLKVVV